MSLALLSLALPTAAAIVLLSSRRAARDREDAALDEVARLQLRIVEVTADLEVQKRRAKCRKSSWERVTRNAVLHLERRDHDLDVVGKERDAARATADACYETGWRAIVERNKWTRAWESTAAHNDELVERLDAANARAEAAELAFAQHVALAVGTPEERDAIIQRAEAAEKARGEAAARVSDLEAKLKNTGEPAADMCWNCRQRAAVCCGLCVDCGEVAPCASSARHASAPVEPAAVVPVALTKYPPDAACTWCDKPAGRDWHAKGRWVYEDLNSDAADDLLPLCAADYGFIDGSEVRARVLTAKQDAARHAARTASATPVAASNWDPIGGRPIIEDVVAARTMGEVATQDDLDDAAVRALLERGPATIRQMAGCLDASKGNIWVREQSTWQRLGLTVDVDGADNALYSLPTAPEAAS